MEKVKYIISYVANIIKIKKFIKINSKSRKDLLKTLIKFPYPNSLMISKTPLIFNRKLSRRINRNKFNLINSIKNSRK